jgi:undecaprenyl pyrophosphate phosphatase UppP
MTHFLLMLAFALVVAVVFGVVSKDNLKDQFRYGLRVFMEFMAVGLLIAWLLYFLPL